MKKRIASLILAVVLSSTVAVYGSTDIPEITAEQTEAEPSAEETGETGETEETEETDKSSEKGQEGNGTYAEVAADSDENSTEISENLNTETADDDEIRIDEEAEEDQNEEQQEDLDLQDENEQSEEADFLSEETELQAAGTSDIYVNRISSGFVLDKNYGFAYGYRKGKTKLSVQNGSSALLTKLDSQYGITSPRSGLACDLRGTPEAGKYIARYTNVGDYQGKSIDLRISVTNWADPYTKKKGKDGTYIIPSIVFYNNRIGANIIAVKRVYFKFDFLETGTDNVVNLKCHMTMQDIDNAQEVRFYDKGIGAGEPTHVYLTADQYLSYSRGSDYTDIKSSDGETENNDMKAWIQIDFEKQLRFSYYMGNSYGSGGQNSIIFLATPKVLGTYEILKPEKRVGNRNQSFDQMQRHNVDSITWNGDVCEAPYETKAGGEFDYIISQRVLPGTYSSFQIVDYLDSCLTLQKAQVTTASGYDVTKNFQISRNEKGWVYFTALSDYLTREEAFNDVTYYFRLQVKVKDNRTVTDDGHFDTKDYWVIKNNGDRTLGSSVEYIEPSYIMGYMKGSYQIKKVDKTDPEKILEGAVFRLDEWDNTKGKYTTLNKKLAYNAESKMYETGELKRTRTNEGKFKVVETKTPSGYEGKKGKEFNITDLSDGTVFIITNTPIEIPKEEELTGEILVKKKIREKDITWAHGNPTFLITVSGKDSKGMTHTYSNYMEFTADNYGVEGDYAVVSHIFSGIPAGTYQIEEGITLRYRLAGIYAESSGVTVSGKKAQAVVSGGKKEVVAFENEKTCYDGYSHTDVLKNIIPLKK